MPLLFSFPDVLNMKAGNKERIAAGVLPGALLLALPLAYGRIFLGGVPLFGEVSGTDFPVLALLSLGVAVWKWPDLLAAAAKDRVFRALLFAAVTGGAIVLLQQISFGWNLRNFLTGVCFFSVPLAGVALGRELRRLLPWFLMILFLADFAATIQDLARSKEVTGLSGNWNWNWTLLLISVPAFAFLLPRSKRVLFALPAIVLFAAGPMLLFRSNASRAALLSALGGLLLTGLFVFLRKRDRLRKGTMAFLFVLLCAGCIAFLWCAGSGLLNNWIPNEIRTRLWEGGVTLGNEYFLSGAGAGRIEGAYTSRLPVEYFDSLHAATLHPHPHNELLFYFCSFGIWGVVWFLLLAGALLRKAADGFPGKAFLCGWAFCILLIHGQLDVILNTPLAGGLFLLLAGMLLSFRTPRQTSAPNRFRELGRAVLWGGALVLFCLNLLSGLYCRSGKLALLAGNVEKGYGDLKKSVDYLPTARNLYALGQVELFDLRNPPAAAETLLRIDGELKQPGHMHSNGLIARALAASGKQEESLVFFEREQQRFPRSAVNMGLHSLVLRQSGRAAEADELEKRWLELMTQKGFRPEEFRTLLLEQELDDSPNHRRIYFETRRK